MTDFVAAMTSILTASAAVTAIAGTRIRPWPAAQSLQLPCVLLHVVSATRRPTMQGSPTYDEALVQVDCLGRSHAERRALADAVRAALSDASTAELQRVLFVQEAERADDVAGNYGAVQEYRAFGRN